MPGLIGYRDGKPVAWVSVGPREQYHKLAKSPVMKPVDDKPVWSVVCFYTALEARNAGVSAAMLRHAARFAQENGATLLEALGQPVGNVAGRVLREALVSPAGSRP